MLVIALASLLTQTPPAPPPPNWIAAGDEETVAAVLVYDHGLSVVVLCRDDRLETRIGGLPASAADIRTLEINLPDVALRASTWIVGADRTTALSTAPAVYARRLRDVGRLTVRIPPEGEGRAVRYELPTPEAHEPLDAVLTACGTPLDDADDAAYTPETPLLTWANPPSPQYPTGANAASGAVQLSCLAEVGGRLRDCEVAAESPSLQGFGRAALKGAERARLSRVDGQEITAPQTVSFTVRFRIRR
ncbi:MAG: hypothetical protein SWI22_00610 [Pseudomonadota bacterium]|nr:hypothetical protein [Pseudomonadota bacterium]